MADRENDREWRIRMLSNEKRELMRRHAEATRDLEAALQVIDRKIARLIYVQSETNNG